MQSNLEFARNQMELARGETCDPCLHLVQMEVARKKSNLTYEDIGTTEQEVAEMFKAHGEGHRTMARRYLSDAKARNGSIGTLECLDYMEHYRQLGAASYESIGITEQEVAELRKQAA